MLNKNTDTYTTVQRLAQKSFFFFKKLILFIQQIEKVQHISLSLSLNETLFF